MGLPGSSGLERSSSNQQFAGGVTRSGNPSLIFPDKAGFSNVTEGDLHLLLKYFISVVPKAEQVRGCQPSAFVKLKYFRVRDLP